MFNNAKSLAFSSSVLLRAAAIICAILFQWPGGVSVPAPSGPEQRDLSLVLGARRADSCAEFFHLLVIRRVLLAIERGRARWTKLCVATHCKRYKESPLRQQIGKKCWRGRHPH